MIIPKLTTKKIIRITETHNMSIENVLAVALENFLHEISKQKMTQNEMTKNQQSERGVMMGHILVVDDEEFIVDLIRMALIDYGYRVTVANCGKEAFGLFKNQQFDMVITDILMPEWDGVHLAMQIEQLNRKTPIVVISGGGKLTSAKSALGYAEAIPSVVHTLKKPFCPVRLCEVVDGVLKHSTVGEC